MQQSGISFLVTNEEFLLLERIVYLEPGIDEVLDKARDEDGLVRLKMNYDDLGECLEALSYEAIQNDSPKDELIALYKKLGGYGKLREHIGKHAKPLPKKSVVDDVYIFDVQIMKESPKTRKIIRTIAISGKKSLYQFAGTIVSRSMVMLTFKRDHPKKKFMNCLSILGKSQPHHMRKE